MAANEDAQQAFAPVLTALASMQSNVDRSQKALAHEYLEKFQKSVRAHALCKYSQGLFLTYSTQPEAWTVTFGILQASDAAVEAKLFAATTLKGKVTIADDLGSSACANCSRSPMTFINYLVRVFRSFATLSLLYSVRLAADLGLYEHSYAYAWPTSRYKCSSGKTCCL